MAETATREKLSPVERLEMKLHPWVSFIVLPLFALANAGTQISFKEVGNPITLAIILGFVVGKPSGIVLFSWLAIRVRIALMPPGLTWKLIAGGGILAGIGFTMALFIANLAFDPGTIDAAKLGIYLASIIAGILGIGVLSWATRDTISVNSKNLQSKQLQEGILRWESEGGSV
jgi:NhaA family Na+:H+ antiporter